VRSVSSLPCLVLETKADGALGNGAFDIQAFDLEGRILAPPQDVRDRAGYILAIGIGLSSLFDESERAELEWLNTSPFDLLVDQI
jgi:hypothetical protein